jgi:5-amino-6-(5-phosphoribosylamino)uracil reductase
MQFTTEPGPASAATIAAHVALPESRAVDRAFVRLNMIASADGASDIGGVSGALGSPDDHAVFSALRAQSDVVLVGMSTAVSEQYHAPSTTGPRMFVVASRPDISGDPGLFDSDRVTLVLPEGAGSAPEGVRTLRSGTGHRVDLADVVARLAGQVVMMEGGPSLAGLMVSLGLVDEFFLTVAPRLVAGESTRVVHGPGADPGPWSLAHGFVTGAGFVFLRYGRPGPIAS